MKRVMLLAVALVLGLSPMGAMAEDEGGGLFAEKPEPKRQPLPWEIPAPGEEQCMPEELALLRELRDRSRAMDVRDDALSMREDAAKELEKRLADEVTRLDGLRAELTALVERAVEMNTENVASLSKMVDSMKAKDAAAMLVGMDEEVVLEVLRGLKAKQAAKVLGAMPPDKSQELGDRYTLVPDPRDGLTEGEE